MQSSFPEQTRLIESHLSIVAVRSCMELIFPFYPVNFNDLAIIPPTGPFEKKILPWFEAGDSIVASIGI
jgi:hypothetical protein